MSDVDTSVSPTSLFTSDSLLQSLIFLALVAPQSKADYHDEKWTDRLAVLCHQRSVVSSPSHDITTRIVVTDKMAAASDDCDYAAHIYQEVHLSLSLSPSAAVMCQILTNWKFIKVICALNSESGNM